MRRHFHKMHGLGNDFVIVDARDQRFDVTPELARATIASVSVLGALHASSAVKAALAYRTR